MAVPAAVVAFMFKRQEATAMQETLRSIAGFRNASNNIQLMIDGAAVASTATADSGAIAAGTWAHGCLYNNSTTPSDYCAYTAQVETIGAALSASQMQALHKDSLDFCTSLGRT